MSFGAPFPGSAINLVYNTSPALVTTTLPVTFTGVSIGPANATRVVVIATMIGATSDTTGITIGGISATKVAAGQSGSGVISFGDLWAAVVPSGTSANIVLSGSVVGSARVGISSYSIYGTQSATPASVLNGANGNLIGIQVAIGSSCNEDAGAQSWSGVVSDFSSSISGGAGHTFFMSSASKGQVVSSFAVSVTNGGGFCFAGW